MVSKRRGPIFLAQVTSTQGNARGIMLVALPDMPDAKTEFSNSDLDPFRLLWRALKKGHLEVNAQRLNCLGRPQLGAQLARLRRAGGRARPAGGCGLRANAAKVRDGAVRDHEERPGPASLNPCAAAETALPSADRATELKTEAARATKTGDWPAGRCGAHHQP